MYCGHCEYSQRFEVLQYCGHFRTHTVFRCSIMLWILPVHQGISGFCTSGILQVLGYFVSWYCSYCEYLQFQNTVISNMRRILGSTKYISTQSAHHFDNAISFFLQKTLTDCPTSGSGANHFLGGQLRALTVFWEYILRVYSEYSIL